MKYFNKKAFFAVTPLKTDKKSHKNVKGYAKEFLNTNVGLTLGSITGGVGGALVGSATGLLLKNPIAGGVVGAGLGVASGGITGHYRSMRKGDRDAGYKPTGILQAWGRDVAASAGNVVPVAGPYVGDYYARKALLRKNK